jgi:hypothetical protein
MRDMKSASIEMAPEVRRWLASLPDEDFGPVAFYLDVLSARTGELPEPHSRPLGKTVRELHVPVEKVREHRITYCLDGDNTVALLTVRRRLRGRRHELRRAQAAMRRRSLRQEAR